MAHGGGSACEAEHFAAELLHGLLVVYILAGGAPEGHVDLAGVCVGFDL